MIADNFNQEFNDIQSLNSIYSQLSIKEDDNFDEIRDKDYVVEKLTKLYSKEFLLIESKELENEVEILNSSFVKLVMSCKEENYRNIGNIFIVYCDYFDLSYIKIYNHFHPNIKKIITNAYIKLVGKEEYDLKKNLLVSQNYQQSTIFDLFNKKPKQIVEDDDEPFTDEEIALQKSQEDDEEYFTEDEITYQKSIENSLK